MTNTNMINPANYYNPFAKYNYVSKTRGVYIPQNTQPLLKTTVAVEKSSSIYSENYDAEADVLNSFEQDCTLRESKGFWAFVNKFFNN